VAVREAEKVRSATAVAPPTWIARLWFSPAAIAVTPLEAPAGTLHLPPPPHAITLPSLFSARLCCVAAEIATTPLVASGAGTCG
jgi:hypothetical protein